MEMKLSDIRASYRKDRMYIASICDPPRVGSMLFSSILEYWKYPPRTPANAQFELGLLKFGQVHGDGSSLRWFLFSIPLADKPFADEAAKKSFVVIRRTIPVIVENMIVASLSEESIMKYKIGNANIQVFPLTGPNVYTLENEKEFTSKLTPENYKHYLNIERQLCHKIMGDDDRAATEGEMKKFRELMERI